MVTGLALSWRTWKPGGAERLNPESHTHLAYRDGRQLEPQNRVSQTGSNERSNELRALPHTCQYIIVFLQRPRTSSNHQPRIIVHVRGPCRCGSEDKTSNKENRKQKTENRKKTTKQPIVPESLHLVITHTSASSPSPLRCRCLARLSPSTVLRRGSAPCEECRLVSRDHSGSDRRDVSDIPSPTSRKGQIRGRSWRKRP